MGYSPWGRTESATAEWLTRLRSLYHGSDLIATRPPPAPQASTERAFPVAPALTPAQGQGEDFLAGECGSRTELHSSASPASLLAGGQTSLESTRSAPALRIQAHQGGPLTERSPQLLTAWRVACWVTLTLGSGRRRPTVGIFPSHTLEHWRLQSQSHCLGLHLCLPFLPSLPWLLTWGGRVPLGGRGASWEVALSAPTFCSVTPGLDLGAAPTLGTVTGSCQALLDGQAVRPEEEQIYHCPPAPCMAILTLPMTPWQSQGKRSSTGAAADSGVPFIQSSQDQPHPLGAGVTPGSWDHPLGVWAQDWLGASSSRTNSMVKTAPLCQDVSHGCKVWESLKSVTKREPSPLWSWPLRGAWPVGASLWLVGTWADPHVHFYAPVALWDLLGPRPAATRVEGLEPKQAIRDPTLCF